MDLRKFYLFCREESLKLKCGVFKLRAGHLSDHGVDVTAATEVR